MADLKNKKKKGGEDNGSPPSDEGQDPNPQMVSMPQAELDKLFADRADRARRTAQTSMLEDLGFEDLDGLKKALTEFKNIQESKKSDLEKLQTELEDAQGTVETLQNQLKERENVFKEYVMRSAVVEAARENSFLKESLDDTWLLVSTTSDLRDELVYDEEARTVKGAKGVVNKVAEMRPHWVQKETTTSIPGQRSNSRRPKSGKNTQTSEPEVPLVRL